MTNDKPLPTTRERIGDVAPKLADLTEQVLFGDIWERPGLSKRDRSVITVTALVAMNRTEQLPFHLRRALENGVTKDELVELITHLAFYSGWPTAMSAMRLAKEAFQCSGDSK
jgi:4-carboxymuconolactone decarboxylase